MECNLLATRTTIMQLKGVVIAVFTTVIISSTFTLAQQLHPNDNIDGKRELKDQFVNGINFHKFALKPPARYYEDYISGQRDSEDMLIHYESIHVPRKENGVVTVDVVFPHKKSYYSITKFMILNNNVPGSISYIRGGVDSTGVRFTLTSKKDCDLDYNFRVYGVPLLLK